MIQTRLIFFFALIVSLSVACKKTSGDKAKVSEEAQVSEAKGVTYQVNTGTSQVLWQGSKPTGTHNGFVKLSEGKILVDKGEVTGGSIVLDMNTITNLDLDGGMKANLEAHLKGTTEGKEDDFFNVNKYPTAKFEITKVSSLANDPEASHLVYGNLTLRDITKEVGFRANISMSDNGITVNTPQFTINRAEWGIKFMSKSFFDDLKDKFIDDNIGLTIELQAKG